MVAHNLLAVVVGVQIFSRHPNKGLSKMPEKICGNCKHWKVIYNKFSGKCSKLNNINQLKNNLIILNNNTSEVITGYKFCCKYHDY